MPKKKEQENIFCGELSEIEKSKLDKRRNTVINKERKKLAGVLERNEIDPDKLQMADGLINRAAYMRITLEEYEDDLKKCGHTEMFSQSERAEPYERERPTARLYNQMIKNYTQVMRQLFDMLPAKLAKQDAQMMEYENKYFK